MLWPRRSDALIGQRFEFLHISIDFCELISELDEGRCVEKNVFHWTLCSPVIMCHHHQCTLLSDCLLLVKYISLQC